MASAISNIDKQEAFVLGTSIFGCYRLYRWNERAASLATAIPILLNLLTASSDTQTFSIPENQGASQPTASGFRLNNLNFAEMCQVIVFGYSTYLLFTYRDWYGMTAMLMATLTVLYYGLKSSSKMDIF